MWKKRLKETESEKTKQNTIPSAYKNICYIKALKSIGLGNLQSHFYGSGVSVNQEKSYYLQMEKKMK